MLTEHDRQVLLALKRHCLRLITSVPVTYTLDEFLTNEDKQDAAIYNILQLGELAKEQLSQGCRNRMSDVPWNLIIKMRHRLVHHYDGHSNEFAWRTIREDIPTVLNAIDRELGRQSAPLGTLKLF